MRILLDTHCWLWLQTAPERFSPEVITLLEDTGNELLFSAASSWEIAIKYGLGKLALPARPDVYVPSRMSGSGTSPLPILHVHALRVSSLPPHHRDPFDRLLVAQAQHEKVPLLTADPIFASYDVEVLRP